ncbi:ComEC/Rec2 family competence protein [Nocardioides sp. TRM66260-LWL]|uniref:ComEC/Rec2 family competence protein n=1 Tax=Nocardioides sp. TRM66260-LWL TaxID=2874478 RepID=UPI001CC504D2|nr:ComEC/Rec2 family competence protein [Nocardioides sp. TRM66260-LWL]MBZ5735880.1 ComEC/Rec2 family competence protein [Nocardioides sp. TRM66260-LWL]
MSPRTAREVARVPPGAPRAPVGTPHPTAALDARMAAVALATWVGALLGAAVVQGGSIGRLAGGLGLAGLLLGVGGAILGVRRGALSRAAAAVLALVVAGAAVVALAHGDPVRHGPVGALAADRASVELLLEVTDDPRRVDGRFEDLTVVRARVVAITARGRSWRLRAPVVVLGDDSWARVPLGATVAARGRLAPADGDVAAVVDPRGPPDLRTPPDVWWRVAARVRAGLRAAVADQPAEQAALVPALVSGDDGGVSEDLADDFRTTGLTHLLAVSGTNLTLVLAALLGVGRWCGVRGRWGLVLAALGIVGFVLVARTEPSVLRAAVMGAVALLSFGGDGRRRGLRALSVAGVVLLLLEPTLATSAGFALSVSATAGILVLAPRWRDALARWLPGPAADAVAVPVAAQLACTPLVAGLSGQVSLIAVVANLLAAPAVAPATILGLVGGLIAVVEVDVGRLVALPAAWSVGWIVTVARSCADVPLPAIGWGTGVVALLALTLGSALLAVRGPWLVARPARALLLAGLLLLVMLVRLPTPGWPPAHWRLVACDVGQGDALVLATGRPGEAVVLDAGPEPALVDRCLQRLGVSTVPLVVLTHYHADHVDGLAGVLAGRSVGAVLVTTLQDPPGGVADVGALAAARGIPVRALTRGPAFTVGDVSLEPLWPEPGPSHPGPGDGSTANAGSVVLLVRVDGLRLMLTGDLEPDGQAALARERPDLRADVLKLPHHGSRHQDLGWLDSLGARVVLVSVGADNDYGHPNGPLLDHLRRSARVLRTDLDGDLAVVTDDGRLSTATRRGP